MTGENSALLTKVRKPQLWSRANVYGKAMVRGVNSWLPKNEKMDA